MSNEQEMRVPLSERLRPDVECAPWVIEEVRKLEAATLAAEARIRELEADSKRLDWLQEQGCAYGFEDMFEGTKWWVSGPFLFIRDLIDAAITEHKENQG